MQHKQFLRSLLKQGLRAVGLCGLGLALAGCRTGPTEEAVFSNVPSAPTEMQPVSVPVTIPNVTEPGTVGVPTNTSVAFRPGDSVTVTFSGVGDAPPIHEERIRDDGAITLPLIGSVVALGKTPGELQKDILALYVPKFYQRLVVTVKPLDQVFYVGGEVRQPGRQVWIGEIRVTQAIQAVGGFTDFANKKNVLLMRADGSQVEVNCLKAMKDPKLDPKVRPGDSITVKRRWW